MLGAPNSVHDRPRGRKKSKNKITKPQSTSKLSEGQPSRVSKLIVDYWQNDCVTSIDVNGSVCSPRSSCLVHPREKETREIQLGPWRIQNGRQSSVDSGQCKTTNWGKACGVHKSKKYIYVYHSLFFFLLLHFHM